VLLPLYLSLALVSRAYQVTRSVALSLSFHRQLGSLDPRVPEIECCQAATFGHRSTFDRSDCCHHPALADLQRLPTRLGTSFRFTCAQRLAAESAPCEPTVARWVQYCSMDSAPLPTLPADVMGRIARATLAAEEGPQDRAWVRLSSVCRTWRDSLRGAHSARVCHLAARRVAVQNGCAEAVVLNTSCPCHHWAAQEMRSSRDRHVGVPLHVEGMTPARLETAAQSGACFGSVHVHLSATPQWPPPSDTPSRILSALAGSAATLTALHGLPLVKPPAGGDPGLGLAAFTELRDLSLRQTWREMDVLQATDLPASLQDLKVVMNIAEHKGIPIGQLQAPPLFVAFDRLQSLRRVTLAGYRLLNLGKWGRRLDCPPLPASLEV